MRSLSMTCSFGWRGATVLPLATSDSQSHCTPPILQRTYPPPCRRTPGGVRRGDCKKPRRRDAASQRTRTGEVRLCHRLGDRLLQKLARWINVNGTPAARLLAETAARAFLRVERRHSEEVGDGFRVLQTEGVERTDINAKLAAGADAIVLNHDRLRPLFAVEGFAHISELVQ